MTGHSTSIQGGQDTRNRLLVAAEELFAARGIEGVSLREIGRQAGAKNVIAAQYWFKTKDGLVLALLDKHRDDVEARRHTILDLYESQERTDLRGLAEALVRPYAAKLQQGVSGAGYLRVMSELMTRPGLAIKPWELDGPHGSLQRWGALVEPMIDSEAIAIHRRFITMRFVSLELAQRARSPHDDHDRIVSHLIDAVVGVLGAPVSDETKKLYSSRNRRSTPARSPKE